MKCVLFSSGCMLWLTGLAVSCELVAGVSDQINELSGELLNIFIEKIEVGERGKRYSRTAEQEIIIHYRDIGVVGAFAQEAEKIAEQRQGQTA